MVVAVTVGSLSLGCEHPTAIAVPRPALSSAARVGDRWVSSSEDAHVLTDDDAIAKMDAAMGHGLVFRHLNVGDVDMMYGALTISRITWVLDKVTSATWRLNVYCERFRRGPGVATLATVHASERYPYLLGEEHKRDLWWAAPAVGEYIGARVASEPDKAHRLRFTRARRFESKTGHELAEGRPACGAMPQVLTLACDDASLLVRPRGARLSYEPVGDENQWSDAWIPPTRVRTSGRKCEIEELKGEVAALHELEGHVKGVADTLEFDARSAPTERERELAQGTERALKTWLANREKRRSFLVNMVFANSKPLFFTPRRPDSPGVEYASAEHETPLETGDYRWIQPE
jgi:hypothetical protein